MTGKYKIIILTRKLKEFTKCFGEMETKLDRTLAVQTGGGNASTLSPNKDVMGPTYWKSDGKHI